MLALASTSPVFGHETQQRRPAVTAAAVALQPAGLTPGAVVAAAGANALNAVAAVVTAVEPTAPVTVSIPVPAASAATAGAEVLSDGALHAASAAATLAASQQEAGGAAAAVQQSNEAAVGDGVTGQKIAASDVAQATTQLQLHVSPLSAQLLGSTTCGRNNASPDVTATPNPSARADASVAGVYLSDASQKAVEDGSAPPGTGAPGSDAQTVGMGVRTQQDSGQLRRVPMGPPAPRKPGTAMPRGSAGAGRSLSHQRKKVITFCAPVLSCARVWCLQGLT